MNTDPIQIRCRQAPWHNKIDFLIASASRKTTATVTLTMHEEHVECDPTFSLDTDQAQILMDDLWNAGLRPSEGTGSAGQLAATQRHLEDMRTLVFKPKPTTP